MPRRDGTGPMGQGAMTGRGMGACTGVNSGFYGAGRGFGGRGMGLGLGCKRGFGGFFAGQGYGLTEKEILSEQKNILKSRLDAIDKQLGSMSEDDEQ
ncbi:DUF5320 domain-containing protein [Alkalibacter mobilis]|uniref:DUF5320 domain-containing protein n=1 Tax=Alkalibacter mobilis TaxID=2787712 RepID=UPI0018A06B76|nr:DUF5320 domain-containing protein [Alkalibacter mobilis]MBF7096985.1 DUF5320 domain-containing protein [Alkalibacter mobilis]